MDLGDQNRILVPVGGSRTLRNRMISDDVFPWLPLTWACLAVSVEPHCSLSVHVSDISLRQKHELSVLRLNNCPNTGKYWMSCLGKGKQLWQIHTTSTIKSILIRFIQDSGVWITHGEEVLTAFGGFINRQWRSAPNPPTNIAVLSYL